MVQRNKVNEKGKTAYTIASENKLKTFYLHKDPLKEFKTFYSQQK